MIEVKNLVKKYGNHLAVDHLDFTIKPGRIYGFLGPNGAGKSTTMNIMTGYLGATEGEVVIGGHDILKEPEEAKRCIGYLPEQPPLYMDMTVREYLEFAAELKKIPRSKRADQVTEVEKMVRIRDVEKRLIRNLSKGYRQRVGLAQAVLGYPEIIILDEPSVGLDPKQIIEIRQPSDTPENLERMLGESDRVELETKASPAEVREILKNVPGIERILAKAGENGVTSVQIQEKKGEDARERIFLAFAERKKPLLTLKTAGATLEDVFMELTQSNRVPDAFARRMEQAAAPDTGGINRENQPAADGGDDVEQAAGHDRTGEGDEQDAGSL